MWRDVKVYKNHAYIVSEAYGHGLQVFDLTLLRSLPRNGLSFMNRTASQVKNSVRYFFFKFHSFVQIFISLTHSFVDHNPQRDWFLW